MYGVSAGTKKKVAVVERWPLLLWRLDCIDGDQNIGRDTICNTRGIYMQSLGCFLTHQVYTSKSRAAS